MSLTQEQREYAVKVSALTDILTTAAHALVKRDANGEVAELEALCDEFLRRFAGRVQPKPSKVDRLISALELDADEVIQRIIKDPL